MAVRRRWPVVSRPGWYISLPLLAIIGIFVLYPVARVILISLEDPQTGAFPSLTAYRLLIESPQLPVAVYNTAVVVLGGVAIALTISCMLAWLIARTDLPMARWLDLVPIVPLLLPAMVEAVGWTALLSPRTGYVNVLLRWLFDIDAATGPFNIFSLGGVTLVVGLYLVPYMYALLLAAFQSYNPALDEASRVMGASIWKTLLRVSLPAVKPAILGALFLGIVVGLAQFAIPAILGTPAHIYVLSTLIFQYTHGYPSQFQAGAAISTILGLVAVLGQIAMLRALRRGGHTSVAGKGVTAQRLPLGRWRRPMALLMLVYLLVVVVLPLLAILLLSLSSYWSIQSLRPDRLTLSNYDFIIFEYSNTWSAIGNSLTLAVLGATVGIALGGLIAYIVVQGRFIGHRLLGAVAMVPLVIPGIVYGVGVLHAFIGPPLVLYGTLAILLIGYVGHFLPHAIRATDVSLRQIGAELEEASRVFGSGQGRTMLRITLPLIRPGVIAGWSLLVILMLRELPISALVYTPSTTVISVLFYNLWANGSLPQVAAFAIILVAVSLVAVLAIRLATGRLGGAR